MVMSDDHPDGICAEGEHADNVEEPAFQREQEVAGAERSAPETGGGRVFSAHPGNDGGWW